MVPLYRPDPFWQIRTESEMPCYHSITQNPIFAKAISKFRQAHKHLHLTKYIYKNRCSEFKLFLQNINIQKKTWNECTCRSILQNFLLYDSTLLDLGSALSITRYLRIGKTIVRPEKFQFLEKGQNGNFDYKIVISVKNPKFIL